MNHELFNPKLFKHGSGVENSPGQGTGRNLATPCVADISTPDFSTPSFNAGLFKSGVEDFMVEKAGVEKSGVEAWG